ncbi:enolase C-terminal domain-like protein [Microbacterium sp. CIAB417]|uniref:enolase C-terminal domain-like protein n=1 Tax=Microbacterium sp. CIAB417 TaxID=2860287 RepID=UPI001FAE0194|nr:enolase C-terminal domain-like protein [Microbacterium sp. CIAB417]
MEITRVTAEVHEAPVAPAFRWRDGLAASGPTQHTANLRIETSDGVAGTSRIPKGRSSAILVEEAIAPLLIGQDALMVERIWHLLHEADRTQHFPAYFLGPVDVALWDIKAQAAGLPLYKLAGGFRDVVPAYASTVTYETVDEYRRIADLCLEQGFRAIKLHAWGDVRRDGELASALRAHVGDDVELMFDASGAHDLSDAIRLAHLLEDAGFAWLEEPMREWGVEPYRRLRSRARIPILSGETSAGLHRNIADFIVNDAADIVRTGVHYKDGITGALRIAHLADAFGMRAEIHGGGLANLHLACAISNTTSFEVIVAGPDATPRHRVASNGTISPPSSPGIGDVIA